MPYSKSPTYTTNETKRFDLNYDIEVRNTNTYNSQYFTDAYIENAIVEHVKKDQDNPDIVLKNRPGATAITSVTGTTAYGCYAWTLNTYTAPIVFFVIDKKLYSSATGSTVLKNLYNGMTEIGWTEFLTSTGTRYLILSDGYYVYTIDSTYTVNNAAPFSILGVPKRHLANPIFLDGYLFVAKDSTGDIYNSDLDNPLSWTAGNYISAEMYPDVLYALSKNNNYIYAIGESSVEFFYNAGNATGTPLARYASGVLQIGVPYLWRRTVLQTDTEVFFVGDTGDGDYSVWLIDGFKPTMISTPNINRLLKKLGNAVGEYGLSSYELRISGHKLFVINFIGYYALVYDSTTKIWYKWSTNTATSFSPTHYLGSDGCGSPIGESYLQDTSGIIYKIDDTVVLDGTKTFTTNITSPEMDFDTFNKKFFSKLTVLGRETAMNAGNNTVSVSWSDDGYTTFNTPRTLPTNWSQTPFIFKLGSSRRRAFRITLNNTNPWIIYGVEVNINKGSI
jgi:hypothetical protein